MSYASRNATCFVALDVETANNTSGSICSLGLARFQGDSLISTYYTLIRPPDEFGEFYYHCIRVHGITPADVAFSPSLHDEFPNIATFIGDDLIVAHNAPFDSRHLHSAFKHYGIDKAYSFACTLTLARGHLNLPNYKLNTICDFLAIPLDNYHNALADAIACGRMYTQLTTHG
jgi:DNA polymerase-3 subunit epsilon